MWPYWAYVAFLIWMILDAVRRRAEVWWFLIMIFLPPIGAIIYFLFVKLEDFSGQRAAGVRRPGARSLKLLEARVRQVGSVQDLVEFGEALIERKDPAQALPHFERAAMSDPDSDRAVYGYGKCLFEAEAYEKAVGVLTPLVDRQPATKNYDGWLCLALSLRRSGRPSEGLESLRQLAHTSAGLPHQVAYAEALVEDGERARAHAALEQALAEFQFAPAFVRSRDKAFSSRAKRLLDGLS